MAHVDLKRATAQIKLAIDRFVREHFREEPRNHLGASVIGHPCERALWYSFRWISAECWDLQPWDPDETSEEKEARYGRLLQRGHAEEDRLIAYLRGAGAEVSEYADEATRTQHRVSAVGGHFGGSLDAFVTFPGLPRAIGEFKTHSAKSYAKLLNAGVERSKPMHVAQMNTYGHLTNTSHALYVPICKNNDSVAGLEFRKIDREHGQQMVEKAERVIRSQLPLAKLSTDPATFECRVCKSRPQCHEGKLPDLVNCRSCHFAEPRPGPIWHCNGYGQTIPADVIPKGCNSYRPIATE